MSSIDQQEKRFASFIIDGENSIEFAISADKVLEATPITGTIQPLPASVEYLEGFMHLRDDAIPIINMKRRLGLPRTDYAADAKVAVVTISQLRCGLLFDAIKDVITIGNGSVHSIHPALKTGKSIISDLVKLDDGRRTLELLDLKQIFANGDGLEQIQQADELCRHARSEAQKKVARFVVFTCLGQDYGVPVEQAQEITFLSEIDDVFKNDTIEGAVQLRGHSIPVLNAARLLRNQSVNLEISEDTRVLVLNSDDIQYGLIVDRIREIICIADDEILPLPRSSHGTVGGIYQRTSGKNIMLIQVSMLIKAQQSELRSVARLKAASENEAVHADKIHSRHLISADCYLVFSIGRKFAIELNDVQEIIEARGLMDLPAASGFDQRVLNLRGCVIPVIDLRKFYGFPADGGDMEDTRLVISRSNGRIVALEVDRILTIYKQVQFRQTPSLNPQLRQRADTLDRLIEFVGDSGLKEHVLVINITAMMDNHLGVFSKQFKMIPELNSKENIHGSDGTTHE